MISTPSGHGVATLKGVIAPQAPEIHPLQGTVSFQWGMYNPLGPEYTVSSQCASRRGGEMTTQGAGFHPSEGAWRPLGTRSYRRALCANRDGARVGPKGAVFSSSDGYSHTRGPEQQHLRALELKPRDRTIKKLHMEAKEGARAPMGGRNTGSGKKMPT